MSVDITAQERSRRPHLYNNPVTRDYPFELCTSSANRSGGATLHEHPVLDTLAGYVLRWEAPVHSTRVDSATGRRYVERNAYARHAFDSWLAENPASAVVVQRDHQGDVIGHWEDLAADEFGLGGRCAIYDTPAGRRAFDAVERGELTAFSCIGAWRPDDSVVEHDEDGPYRRILLAQLREAGPVDAPADDFAVIVQVGAEIRHGAARMLAHYGDPEYRDSFAELAGDIRGDLAALPLDEFLDEFARLLGAPSAAHFAADEDARGAALLPEVMREYQDQAAAALFEDRMRPYQVQALTDEHDRRTGRIVSALKEARRRANSDYDWWSRGGSFRDARDGAQYRESKAHAERVEADLLEHLDGDAGRLRRTLSDHGVPRLPSDLDRIRNLGRQDDPWR